VNLLRRSALAGFILLLMAALLGACSNNTHSRYPPASQTQNVAKVTYGHYVVRRGDTLYSIARRHGWDWRALAAHNRIGSPYRLNVGQIIRFDNRPLVRAKPSPSRTTNPARPARPAARPAPSKPQVTVRPPKPSPSKTVAALSAIKWQWPSEGTLIARFADNNGLNQGIDIAGKMGQPVKAAADGVVTYAGNGLYGNGEALIIKHGSAMVVSVYGHNSRLLVKEQQQVKAGQVIAEMGASGTDRVKLHFEIRHQSKAVNPLLYLPKR